MACEKRGANPKASRLWYKLNQNTKIRVRTGAGMSEYAEVGAVVGQGTIAGALVSQAVLDEGIRDNFSPGDGDELNYGLIPMGPLLFQDDLIHSSEGIREARIACAKIDKVVKQLNLRLHEDKSCCILIGSQKQRQDMRRELELEPLSSGNIVIHPKENVKWLGQIISSDGLAASVSDTVKDREGKIRGANLEIIQIINDWRSQVVGGMETALVLWESCCVSSLLHGAGTWTNISATTLRRLNQIQNSFLRMALQLGPGAPLVSLLWDTQVLDMSIRIHIEKVMMVIYIRNLEETSLASQIYEEQKRNHWPGLASETKQICQDLGIENCNTTSLSKTDYKKILISACHAKNEETLRSQAKGKCARILSETYGKKDYITQTNIHNVRQTFRSRFRLQPFAGNYSKDRRFQKSSWLCLCKEAREEESHLMSGKCSIYGDLALKYKDFSKDEVLVQFFTEVLARRDQLSPGGGEDTTVGARSVPCVQDEPVQGLHPIGPIQL